MIVEECVHAYSATYASAARDGVFNPVGMDAEVVDTGGYHDNATNNSRLTFPNGGIFLVIGSTLRNDTGAVSGARLAKNGVSVGYEYYTDGFASSPVSHTGPTAFWLENFAANDYMQIQSRTTAGGAGLAKAQMCALQVSDYSCMVGGTGATAASPVLFPTVIFDPQSMATATDRIEVKKAGYYLCLFVQADGIENWMEKNSSGAKLYGSYCWAPNRTSADYTVGWFEVGDYVRVIRNQGTISHRQFAMIYLGGAAASLAYTYNSTDLSNTMSGYTGVIKTDTEWLDTGRGHPRNGYQYNASPVYCTTCGQFNMEAGYHFGLAKISTDGGTFLQNDGVKMLLNGADLGIVVSNNRHSRPNTFNTTIGFACFQAVYGDTFEGLWVASTTYIEASFTPYTNVFVTDASQWTQQIYRRL